MKPLIILWSNKQLYVYVIISSWGKPCMDMKNHADTLQWRHNDLAGVSNHQIHDCLLKPLFTCRSKKTSKLHVTGLCVGNSPLSGEFPAQRASNTENVAIWWRHHADQICIHCSLFIAFLQLPLEYIYTFSHMNVHCPDNKVHGTNIGPIWGRQDPGGPHAGPMNFAIWVGML